MQWKADKLFHPQECSPTKRSPNPHAHLTVLSRHLSDMTWLCGVWCTWLFDFLFTHFSSFFSEFFFCIHMLPHIPLLLFSDAPIISFFFWKYVTRFFFISWSASVLVPIFFFSSSLLAVSCSILRHSAQMTTLDDIGGCDIRIWLIFSIYCLENVPTSTSEWEYTISSIFSYVCRPVINK